jgi:hypothetical protein
MTEYLDLNNPENLDAEMRADLIKQISKSDHFYIIFYCKKRQQIEQRRCIWDSQSKLWETKQNKIAITALALDNEEYTIDGYRTFTDIFQVVGRKSLVQTSEELQ